MGEDAKVGAFIVQWRDTGGSELANTQSFINGLCRLIGVAPPDGSHTDEAHNDYVFERRVFQDNGDGTSSFGRIDTYRRGAFILEAKQGSNSDRAAVSTTLDPSEAAVVPISNVIPSPDTPPDQVGAIQATLTAAAPTMAAQDAARNFKGKRASTVRPVLNALASVGLARRLTDGRYAA